MLFVYVLHPQLIQFNEWTNDHWMVWLQRLIFFSHAQIYSRYFSVMELEWAMSWSQNSFVCLLDFQLDLLRLAYNFGSFLLDISFFLASSPFTSISIIGNIVDRSQTYYIFVKILKIVSILFFLPLSPKPSPWHVSHR